MRYDTRAGEEPVTMKHAAGAVTVRFRGAPPLNGVAREGALVVSVEWGGEQRGYFSPGVYVECPLTLASGLDALLDCLGGRERLAAAALDALALLHRSAP